ncbi:armadillo repeat-containing protein 3 isoform X1 [Esox lucius]|uniref:EDR1/CTR1/ARMC3-like peptidase-like domain-containing protein n=2 Tax=Esox lucius TaxID=8010 RepID=A0AAY5KSB8_ESOLU|nr:armadillo repeat-containing protein 3 isoform X1 [Esox lucius]XP_034145171.1 armadillo repeat-containing protein 3 isoform X1 [Esox lucius]
MGKKVKKETEPLSKDVFDPLPIESKKAATVVLLLSSPEEEVLAKACEAIHKFAEKGDENRSSLLGLGAVEPLSRLISHEDRQVRRNAFMALGVMAANSDVKRLLKKLDVIPSIIGKLSPEEDVLVHEFATLCLASLSVNFSCKVQISEQEGLAPLLQLLSSPDPDVQKNSLECIFHLVQDLQSRVAVRDLNGVPVLLELLRSEFPIIQQLALRTLAMVTMDRGAQVTFKEEQGFDRLLEVLRNREFCDLHGEALRVFSNCLEDGDSLQPIREAGGLQTLLRFVSTPARSDVQTQAARLVCRVAQSSENCRRLLHEQDIEKSLLDLLSVEGDGVGVAACLAIAAVGLNLASKDAFRNLGGMSTGPTRAHTHACTPKHTDLTLPSYVPGGVRVLVQLLDSEGGEVRPAAAQALFTLTQGSQLNADAVCEAEGVESLVRQLCDLFPGAAAHAAAVLTNMAEQEVLRGCILSHGAMAALLEPLRSADVHTLVRATQLVSVLACDAVGRADLRNAGGLAPLVKLLRSNHKDVRRNACWAISVCANDELNAIEMCNLGALDLLQEINCSVNRRSTFSETAHQRLLNSNLSLKYSLTNTLAFNDITADGFYDPGQARAGQRVLTLEDLSKQPVHQRRPVIAINAKPHDTVSVDQSEERQQDSPAETHITSVLSSKGASRTPRCVCVCVRLSSLSINRTSSLSLSSCSRGKSKGWNEDEKRMEEDEGKPRLDVTLATGRPWLPYDAAFHALVNEATKNILPLLEEREQYSALARLVSEAMGGPVAEDRQHDFPWELHLGELRQELQSNVVPIGRIHKGTYYHRALLYKVLADRIGVSCSLVRGEYDRAWNEVLVCVGMPQFPTCQPQPRTHLVDLIHQPGRLLRANTPQAIRYQTI